MATEVFNRIGEAELHSENPRFYRKSEEENNIFEKSDKFEKIE